MSPLSHAIRPEGILFTQNNNSLILVHECINSLAKILQDKQFLTSNKEDPYEFSTWENTSRGHIDLGEVRFNLSGYNRSLLENHVKTCEISTYPFHNGTEWGINILDKPSSITIEISFEEILHLNEKYSAPALQS